MTIKIYFQSNGKEELLAIAKSLSEANKIMQEKIASINFKSYYTRINFEDDKRVWIDYGSHTKFFIFELEDSNKSFMKLFHDFYKISALEKILKELIHEVYFSIYNYSEEAVCLEEVGENFITYIGEKNQKHNIKSHINVDSAIKEMIHLLTESDTEEKELLEKYEEKTKFITC